MEIPNVQNMDIVGELARLETRNRMFRGARFTNMNMRNQVLFSDDNINNVVSIIEQETYRDRVLRKTIYLRTSFCLFRVLFLILFFILDEYKVNNFLEPLITLLVIHEILIIINFIIYFFLRIIQRVSDSNNPLDSSLDLISIKKLVEIIDLVGNILFFCWFIWGNYKFMWLKDGVLFSLQQNKYLTYYITLLVLCGYFIYSRVIFTIIFLIIFGPCILFIILDDYLTKERNRNRVNVNFKIFL